MLYREHGITETASCRWRQKFGGMSVSETQRLRALQKENARFKQLLAERDLEVDALRVLLAKKIVTVAARREAVQCLVAHELSRRRTCVLLQLQRSTFDDQAHSDGMVKLTSPFPAAILCGIFAP